MTDAVRAVHTSAPRGRATPQASDPGGERPRGRATPQASHRNRRPDLPRAVEPRDRDHLSRPDGRPWPVAPGAARALVL